MEGEARAPRSICRSSTQGVVGVWDVTKNRVEKGLTLQEESGPGIACIAHTQKTEDGKLWRGAILNP